MKCVKCSGVLQKVEIGGLAVDQCDQCAGIWFDARELDRVLHQKSIDALRRKAAPSREDDERRGRCPRCKGGGEMIRVASTLGPIHIDTCPICGGQWLDGGELEVLRREGFTGSLQRFFNWILDLG
ncbi:MAG: zf-TFIIB domain-containing protein [Minicystis sp.]